MLEGTYSNDPDSLEQVYENALAVEDINFDAWLGLVNLYIDEDRSDAELYSLALRIIDSLTYYPRPMYDLLNLIEPNITDNATYASFSTAFKGALTNASKATSNESLQPNACKQVANALLGNVDSTIATFSFDGENAGEIVLAERYQGVDGASSATWEYCLTGRTEDEDGSDWNLVTTNSVKLTNEEIESITPDNDILIHIVGVDYSDENIFTIDIQNATMPSDLYANDLENAVIGATDTMEWRFSEDDDWTLYATKKPDLSGEKTVTIRIGATGQYVASDSQSFTFTTDTDTDDRKYVSIEHLSINSVSSEATSNAGHARYAIDGNINTRWHSNYSGSDYNRWIIIELDDPIYLSAIEYTPTPNTSRVVANGTLRLATIYAGMDLDEVKANSEDCIFAEVEWACNQNIKTTDEFSSGPVLAKYIKIQTIDSWGQYGTTGANFTSAAMINLFEDITKIPYEISFDETEPTNGDVKATLTLDNSFTLASAEGLEVAYGNDKTMYTYTFTENGEYIFTLMYNDMEEGTLTAKVDWIDKAAPVVEIDAHAKTHEITANINVYDPGDDGSYQSGINDVNVSLMVKKETTPLSSSEEINEDDYEVVIENVEANEDGVYKFTEVEDGKDYLIVVQASDNVGNTVKEMYQISTGAMQNITNDEIESTFDTYEPTNESVTVKIEVVDSYILEEIKTNDYTLVYSLDGGNTWPEYTEDGITVSEENVTILIALRDSGNNIGEYASIVVDNIDKTAPEVNIVYTEVDSEHEKDIQVTITANEKIKYTTELRNAGWTLSEDGMSITKIYDDTLDEDDEIVISDLAGNTTKATVSSNAVNGVVDHDKYYVEIEYYNADGRSLSDKNYTNQNIIAVLASGDEHITVTNNNGSNNYTFTENGTYTFNHTYSNGQTGTITAIVSWIDKVSPEVSITLVQRTLDEIIVDVTMSDDYSGIDSFTFTVEDEDGEANEDIYVNKDGNYVIKLDPEKDYKITAMVQDKAGNTTGKVLNVPKLTEGMLEVNSSYKLIEEGVEVTITSNSELEEVEGWELSEDKYTLTKVYSEPLALDENETFTITDVYERTIDIEISSTTINSLLALLSEDDDDENPKEIPDISIEITYVITDEGVEVTITSNSELEELDGWELSITGYSLTRVYSELLDENEIIEITDENGNTIIIEISKTEINELLEIYEEIQENLNEELVDEEIPMDDESSEDSSEDEPENKDDEQNDEENETEDTSENDTKEDEESKSDESSDANTQENDNSEVDSENNKQAESTNESEANNDSNTENTTSDVEYKTSDDEEYGTEYKTSDDEEYGTDYKTEDVEGDIPYTGNSNVSVYVLALFILVGIGLAVVAQIINMNDKKN